MAAEPGWSEPGAIPRSLKRSVLPLPLSSPHTFFDKDSSLFKLVKKSLIADLQVASSAFAIPFRAFQSSQDQLTLLVSRCVASSELQGGDATRWSTQDFVSGVCPKIFESEVRILEYHDFSCQILEFSNISRPVIPQQGFLESL